MAQLLYQGHASFRITADNGKVIYIDPYAGEGYDLPADLILVTHQHYDHNRTDLPAKNKDCVIYQNTDAQINGEYKTADIAGIHIEATQAYNANHPASECVGYLLTVDDKLLYFAGDTAQTTQMRSMSGLHIDYAFLPVDGIYTMDTKEASFCAELIGAAHSVPIHTSPGSLFDLETAERFSAKGRLIIKNGETVTL